jgi:hypothetical protein
MAKATAKSSSKATVKVVINERRRVSRKRKAVAKKPAELPPIRIFHEYFSQPTFAQLPNTLPTPKQETLGVPEASPPLVGITPPPRTPPTPITIPDTTPQRSGGMMAQVAADAKRKFDAQFSREPVPNVFSGAIEPRTLFANEALEQAFDAGHIVSRRGR